MPERFLSASQRALSGHRLLRLALAALVTTAVAAYNGFPLTYPDSGNYLANAHDLIQGRRPWFFFRPLTYGVFLAPFTGLHALWLVPLVQGGLVAWVVDLCLGAVGRGRPVRTGMFVAVFAVLSLVTSIPWFSGQLMPDVMTGLVILLAYLMVWPAEEVGRRERWLAALLLVPAIASHLSHVPLYALLAGILCGARLLADPPSRARRALGPLLVRVVAPWAAAVGLLIGTNLVLYRTPVLSRSSSLFALAHLVGDSLAQRHLARACATERYLLCAERDSLRAEVDWFLWDARGPRERYEAALARGDSTFLTEAAEIVRGTLREEWDAALAAALRGTGRQLVTIGLHRGELAYSGSVDRALTAIDPAAAERYRASRQVRGRYPLAAINRVQGTAVVLGLLAIVAAWPRLRGSRWRPFVGSLCLGVILNAFVVASLARVHPRYQSRVVWLVPLAAVVAGLQGAGAGAGVRSTGRQGRSGTPER